MKAQLGKHFFGRHRQVWGIWIYSHVCENGSVGTFVKDVSTYEEAVAEVYKLNGWGQPKSIHRKF